MTTESRAGTGGLAVYLASTGLWGMSVSMQQLLIPWLLIGTLALPAAQVGAIQGLIGIPGFFLMLWGGAAADRGDPRRLLIVVFACAPLLQVGLIAADQAGWINTATVALWGLGMSTVVAFTSAPQQAILSRIAGGDLQRGVSASTAIMSLTQIAGLTMAGQMDRLGLTPVLLAQALSMVLAALAIRRLAPQEPSHVVPESAMRSIVEGLRATYQNRVVYHVILINFISAIFNAGSFMTVFPFIIKRVYAGDAWLLAMMMVLFYASALVSNLVLMKFMPLARPGRAYLLLQLSRMVFLGLLWIEPAWWLLIVAIIAWGANMGVTMTLARTVVQESAAIEFRARILSVLNLGMLGSPLIGAVLLGLIIEWFGTLNALVPGMITSLALFIYGAACTRVWQYRSITAATSES